ncbi:hypothetical protein ENBRE01_3290 [Enteropsectra breve]|nr:hypothetical protein ENBRE01_3290 [Enteropsectra breve]
MHEEDSSREKYYELQEYLQLLDSSSENENCMSYTTACMDSISEVSHFQFLKTFRMSRACFDKLVEKIRTKTMPIASICKKRRFLFFSSLTSALTESYERYSVTRMPLYIG